MTAAQTIPVTDLAVPPTLRAQAGSGAYAVEVVRPIATATVAACIAAVEPLVSGKADQATLEASVALLRRRALVNALVFS